MAEYTARVNAIDSYTEDFDTGAISRGAALTAAAKGYYNYTSGDSGHSEKLLRVLFPAAAPASYSKKRLKAAALSCYITAKRGSAGGSLPPGVTFGYEISNRGGWGFMPGGVEGSFPGVTLNAYYAMYAKMQPFSPIQTIRVYAGTSDMPYTNVTYSYDVSATIQSHTGANTPFVTYTYEDVMPTVTGAFPTGGFVNFGMWSPWAELITTIANVQGTAITLSAFVKNNGIVLRWQTSGAYLQYIVYRDDTEIAAVSGEEYVDYRCNGKHAYHLRGVTATGQYTISNGATEILSPVYAYIAIAGEWDWLTLEGRRGAHPVHDTAIKPTTQYLHYSGRRLPVAELSEFEDTTHSFDFTLWHRSKQGSVEKLQRMVGSSVVYKDSGGDFAAGILDSLSVNRDNEADVNFTIVEVSVDEL